MGFHWILSNNKFAQVSRTLLSIQTDLKVWMLLIRISISNSSSPLFKPLETVPRAPITIGITVTLIIYIFLSSKAIYFSLLFLRYSFLGISAFFYLLKSNKRKKESLYGKNPLLIQYLYTDQILFSNWSNFLLYSFSHNSFWKHLI